MSETKIQLSERELPTRFYNIQADLPEPLPPVMHPGTGNPITPDDLAPLFPMALIEQEVSTERYIEIPEPVLDVYRTYRPTPMIRALRLEKLLDTPAQIYFKYEGVSPPGSHKPNTAIAQAYYNKSEGVKRLITETGAGQWGSALAYACNLFDLECEVFMVRSSYEQKPYRKSMIETWNGTILPSPSESTEAGRKILSEDPDSPGSLGIAISEAVEVAVSREDTKYSLGSVLNHVLLHQTIIGQESILQFKKAGVNPDILIGCVGGGSNFSGFILPFVNKMLNGDGKYRFIAVEPTAAPSLTRGHYKYDFGDTAGTTPLIKMYTLGHSFIPAPIHAGGLRYHGMAPIVCHLYDLGMIEAVALQQNPVFEAGVMFARTEGIIPAPESAHAIRVAVDEALKCRETGEKKVIAFELSGHGHFDMSAYDAYFANGLIDSEFPAEQLEEALKRIPQVEQ